MAVCGNGVVEPGEECDDGNPDALDGCDGLCLAEEIVSTPFGTQLSTSIAAPNDPIAAAMTSPTAGALRIVETSSTVEPPDDYSFIARQVHVEAPANSTANPLVLTFTLDDALFPVPGDPSGLEVFRNGSLVGPCTGLPGRALPNPCVMVRAPRGQTDVGITVVTSSASDWNFGTAIVHRTVDRCLIGTKLVLQDNLNKPARRRLLLRSHDTPELIVGDGTDMPALMVQGGSLRVTAIGGDGFDETYPLPAEGWQPVDPKHPGYGLRYRDKDGPITTVVFKANRLLLVKGAGPALVQSLGSEPTRVEIDLQLGDYRYRLDFGGDPRQFRANKRLLRKWSIRPACAAGG